RDTHLFVIPFELGLEPHGEYAEVDPLGEWRGNAEIRACRTAALACANPVTVVARRAFQKFRGKAVVAHLLDGEQACVFAVGARRDHALVADKQAAVAALGYQAGYLLIELCVGIGGLRLRRWLGVRFFVFRSRLEIGLREYAALYFR